MADRSPRWWWHTPTSSVGLVAVAVAAGLLFATNARLFQTQGDRPASVVDLVRSEGEGLDALQSEVDSMRSERDDLLSASGVVLPTLPDADLVAAAATPLSGAGVRVRLWDAPALSTDDEAYFDANDLVVHQGDVEAVINALWAGGAEGVTVQGERLTSTSAVRCVGNVLLLHGHQYSPPYVIEAVGDRSDLHAALDADPTLAIYQQYVEAVDLGWELTDLTAIDMPAYSGPATLSYAQVIE